MIIDPTSQRASNLSRALNDGMVVAWRNLKRVPRIPELAIFAIIQSIIFVLLFAVVFGGAIPLPGGGSYREFLLPGIFVQTIAFAAITTAVGVADDMKNGIIDRMRSLPMARSAVLSGRAMFDLVYNSGILIVMMVTGVVAGWRVHGSVAQFAFGVVLLLLFAFAMSWVGICLGLFVQTSETAQQIGFIVILPLTFFSNVFVPPQTLPSWLQPFAEWNPVSTLTAATRDLWGNPNPYASEAFPSQHPALMTVIWVIVIVALFASFGVRRYRSLNR